MDTLIFGAGCCGIQVTFESQNLDHATFIHDSFIPLAPVVGVLSASAPIYKSQLANVDYRWKVLSECHDHRTEEEKDPNSEKFIPKPRWSAMNHYISHHPYFLDEKINDGTKINVDEEHFKKLIDAGISERLAYHLASLFVNDALVIFENHTHYDPESTEHFENFNSTVWNSVRFKPPPALDSKIGWRVEFRTLDNQITDFENAAYITLVNLMTRVLNDFEVNLSMPISLGDENIERAQGVDAVLKQKFWFRKHIVDKTSDYTENKSKLNNWDFSKLEEFKNVDSPDSEFVEMTVLDILEGNKDIGNTGLLQLGREYMDINKFSEKDKEFHNTMLNFLAKRAKGEVKTGARFMRDFVLNHPAYKQDSIVNNEICYDLVKETTSLGIPAKWDESLLGEMPEFMDSYIK